MRLSYGLLSNCIACIGNQLKHYTYIVAQTRLGDIIVVCVITLSLFD